MRIAFAAFVLAAATMTMSPALSATTCQAEPEPVVPAIADFKAMELKAAKAASDATFVDVKQFQTGVNVYRECLNREIAALEDKLKAADEPSAVDKAERAKLVTLYNSTVETEKQLVEQFNAMLDSLCERGDKPSCPKP